MPAFDEASLVFWDDKREDCFDSVGYNFGEDFVACVAEGDWPEEVEVDCSFLFRDKHQEGRFCAPTKLVARLQFSDHLGEIRFYYFPSLLIESGSETVQAWGLVWVHLVQCLLYFLLCYFLNQPDVDVLLYEVWNNGERVQMRVYDCPLWF